MCESCGCHVTAEAPAKIIEVHESLLAANREQAEKNRRHIEKMGAVAVNLISSPGSGKTTLLEHTIERLAGRWRLGVIEGDIETERDAERIRKKGVPVVSCTAWKNRAGATALI